jgi:hypothetical protein
VTAYAAAHELEPVAALALRASSRFLAIDDGLPPMPLLSAAVTFVGTTIAQALAAEAGEEEPCFCDECIAEIAALN